MGRLTLWSAGVFLLLIVPVIFAGVAPNKGSDASVQKASDTAKANANVNAAFNRIASAPADCIYAIYYETENDYVNNINGIPMGPIIHSGKDGFRIDGMLIVCGEVTFR